MHYVTGIANSIKQPRGGYINPKEFEETLLDDGITLNENENIHPGHIGTAVDYLTRFVMGAPSEEAFKISLMGSKGANDNLYAYRLLSKIHGLDNDSISCACQLVGYDVCYRSGLNNYRPVREIVPNQETIDNIITMVNRCVNFWNKYGPIIRYGFTFEGAETLLVSSGEGDYLTKDTLWDLKVLKSDIKSKHTLQVLMYYIMGCHSKHKEFLSVKKLGFYNPRLNKVYLLKVSDISGDTINKVAHDVIGYGLTDAEKEAVKSEERKNLLISYDRCKKSKRFQPPADLDRKIYGTSSKNRYISNALPPKVNPKNPVFFEKDPVFWRGEHIPDIIFEQKLPYIIRFKSCFKLREGHTAFVMNRSDLLYSVNEPLTTSDVFNFKTGKYTSHYIDFDGKRVRSMPVLTLTGDDFELFKITYDVTELEILDGCYFK